MSYITVDTKLVALLGTPLGQSISYLTQNQVYRELGMDYFYFQLKFRLLTSSRMWWPDFVT